MRRDTDEAVMLFLLMQPGVPFIQKGGNGNQESYSRKKGTTRAKYIFKTSESRMILPLLMFREFSNKL